MATRAMSLGTHEFGLLKETLHAQQELLQKLYNELDVERESSATAADETLSMIIRLQAEKATMEMEAVQYKRIAEEKMLYAQETLETFQEVIYQKEMQIASLEFQVQAYKFKLSSLGVDDLASSELQFPENMLRRNGVVGEVVNSSSSAKTLRRGYSLPPRVNAIQGDCNAYLEEIRKLEEKVKTFACLNNLDDSRDQLDVCENYEEVGVECSVSVHDIFEVPKSDEKEVTKPLLSRNVSGVQKLVKHPTFGVADFELKQLNRRLKQLEDDGVMTRVGRVQEISNETGEEELKLLREIIEKVEAMHAELARMKAEKSAPKENRSFGCFKEVMLCFLP